ncbi:hypothetical protein PINS_up006041 [Pythium insidiosum]|nr:hypothetical protein PINS_up006041 [Pythium insidiosum]
MCIALQALFEVGETIDSLFEGVKVEPPDALVEGVTAVQSARKASIEACWDCWMDDKRQCRDLTLIPPFVFEYGAFAIRVYARELAASKRSVIWHNIGIIDPTLPPSSKPSVPETTVESDPFVAAFYDCFDTSLETGATETHDVAFWHCKVEDDNVDTPHSVLLSHRTVFLFVVDLEACANDLNAAEVESDKRKAVIENRILRYYRGLTSRVSTADVVFIGKTQEIVNDTSSSQPRYKDVVEEITARCREDCKANIDDTLHRFRALMTVHENAWCFVPSIDSRSVPTILSSIQSRLGQHESGYAIPESFSAILRLCMEAQTIIRSKYEGTLDASSFKKAAAEMAPTLSDSDVDMVIKCYTKPEISDLLMAETAQINQSTASN